MNRQVFKIGRNKRLRVFVLAVAAVGLLLTLGNARAQEFKDSNFKGRYICRSVSDDANEASIMLLNADGKGKFKDGKKAVVSHDFEESTLVSGCSANAGEFQPCPCVFTLSGSSSYAVTSDGTATASLVWTPAGGNDVACPTELSGFSLTDQWSFVLAQGGTTTVVASNNNGFEDEPGLGSCTRTGTQ